MLQCVAVCCSVLQCFKADDMVLNRDCEVFCGTVCYSPLQCAAMCCSVLQCVVVCCRVLQGVAVCCRVLRGVAGRSRVPRGATGCVAGHGTVWQSIAGYFRVL